MKKLVNRREFLRLSRVDGSRRDWPLPAARRPRHQGARADCAPAAKA